jgi:phage shock protein C
MIMEERSGLYRSAHDNMIGGVAGGIAESTNLDPTLIRILFILMVLVGGGGVLLYIILWIVLPLNEQAKININSDNMEEQKTQENGQSKFPQNQKFKKKDDGSLIAGLILITLGVIFLVIRYVPRIDFGDLWPVILIVIGIVLLRNAFVGKK